MRFLCCYSTRNGCVYSVARSWKERILGFWITPSKISIALAMVVSPSQASGPDMIASR